MISTIRHHLAIAAILTFALAGFLFAVMHGAFVNDPAVVAALGAG
jgi:hypothetical protein